MTKNIVLTISIFLTFSFANSLSAQLFKSIDGDGDGSGPCISSGTVIVNLNSDLFTLVYQQGEPCPTLWNFTCNNMWVGLQISGGNTNVSGTTYVQIDGCDIDNGSVSVPIDNTLHCGFLIITVNLYCATSPGQYSVINSSWAYTTKVHVCCPQGIIQDPDKRSRTPIDISVNNQREEIYVTGYTNKLTYRIFSVDGKLIETGSQTNKTTSPRIIPIIGLEKGSYIIQTNNEKDTRSSMFVKI